MSVSIVDNALESLLPFGGRKLKVPQTNVLKNGRPIGSFVGATRPTAGVRHLARVLGAKMNLEGALLGERLPTMLTDIRSFTSMCHGVHRQGHS